MAGREITRPIVVVCEGPSDCGLINALTDRYSWTPKIQALCSENSGGFPAIPAFINGLSGTSGWRTKQGFLLVVDANGDPVGRLREANAFLAPFNLQVDNPYTIEENNLPHAVYLMPKRGQAGCLEDLLVDAVKESDTSLITCVDAFAFCTRVSPSWAPNQRAKMRVHSLIAALCEDDPASALSRVWNYSSNPIPILSSVFADLVGMLAEFASRI